jgi:ribonucleotide reductase alpha subunit
MSNLCAEIVEYSTPDSPACCTLASVALQNFVMNGGSFDFVELMRVVEIAIESLDKIVDCNSYPTEGSRKNNMYFRPLGLGVQGLADAFRLLRIPFLSPRAEQLDMLIHEAMYFAALSTTCRLAQKLGPCPAWNDGAIDTTAEYHLWMEDMKRIGGEFAGVDPRRWKVGAPGLLADFPVTGAMWDALEADVKRYGVRNTYLRANMPTVNTGDIIGSSGPSTEPVNYNAFNKTTVGSNKMVKFDTNMIKHLTELGVWDAGLANAVATDPFGRLPELARPGWDDIKEIYLTIYEMKQSALFRRAGMRQAFIDQTQSFNQFLSSRDMTVLRGVIELGFKYGLKTISYYTRMPPAKDAGKNIVWERPQVCSRDNPDCVACQS